MYLSQKYPAIPIELVVVGSLYSLQAQNLSNSLKNMLWGKEEPTIRGELGSHVRCQGPWKLVSVLNRFGINGKEKPHPTQGILSVKS